MEDEKKSEETTEETPDVEVGPEPPKWEYRKSFKINERMKEVIGLTIKVTESELAVLRRKLDKLTYGS